jgi:hypothetical protein
MDLGRNYLDDGAWTGAGGGAMLGIPDAPANHLVIDFTHGIDQSADSANQKRWRERLSTIATRWGAKGSDSLWCAPTDEVVDYLRGARAAKATITKGALAVALPDDVPGTALTIKLTGLDARARLEPPKGAIAYRQGDTAWITTPPIGLAGAKPPARLVAAYDGPPGEIDLHGARAIAGVQCSIFGDLPAGFSYKVTLRTAGGERPVAEQTLPPGWFVSTKVHPIAPTSAPITATAAHVDATKGITRVVVWAIDGDSAADPAAKPKSKPKR